MLIYGLLFLLLTSFLVHIITIVIYVRTKDKKYFFWFIATVFSNIVVAGALMVVALTRSYLVKELNIRFFFWLLSGFIASLMFIMKLIIFRNVYRRSRDPAWYHFNYFGKKVYEKGIVRQIELVIIYISMPFLLMFGAYFISGLLAMFKSGKG